MIKRLLAAAAAAVIGASAAAVTFCAEEKKDEAAQTADSTMCFDTDTSLGYISTFGDIGTSGLTFEVTSEEAEKNGSIALKENFSEPPSSETSAGITFNSADFGLPSLAGCRITLKVYAMNEAGADKLAFYSDGDIFMSQDIAMTANPYWQEVSIEISEDVNNTNFGMLISSIGSVKGTVCYIDNLRVYDKNGNMAENIGDFKVIEKSEKRANSTLMTVIFVILIIAVVGLCAWFILKHVIWRYR